MVSHGEILLNSTVRLCPTTGRVSKIMRSASCRLPSLILDMPYSSASGNKGTLKEGYCIYKLKCTVLVVRKMAVMIVTRI